MTEEEVARLVLSKLPQGVRVETAVRHEPDDPGEAVSWKVQMIYEAPDNSGSRAVLSARVNDATGEVSDFFWCIG